jgi:predicted nucleic acid-binding protein
MASGGGVGAVTETEDVVFFDTSIWVRYLRPRGAETLKVAAREAIEQDRVAICAVVRTELLIGARDSTAYAVLIELLAGVRDVPILEDIWTEAARLGFEMRKQGVLIPLPDLLIAVSATRSDRVLWHVDAGYERIRHLSSLRTRHWQIDD